MDPQGRERAEAYLRLRTEILRDCAELLYAAARAHVAECDCSTCSDAMLEITQDVERRIRAIREGAKASWGAAAGETKGPDEGQTVRW